MKADARMPNELDAAWAGDCNRRSQRESHPTRYLVVQLRADLAMADRRYAELAGQLDEQAATIQRMASEALHAGSNDLHQWEVIQRLTGELERARDLAVRSGYFQNSDGTDWESLPPTDLTRFEFDPPLTDAEHSWFMAAISDAPSCGCGLSADGRGPCPFCQKAELAREQDRPSAYDMPVGSVVELNEYVYVRSMSVDSGWLRCLRNGPDQFVTIKVGIQSGWIEGLFSDGLVTEWRLP